MPRQRVRTQSVSIKDVLNERWSYRAFATANVTQEELCKDQKIFLFAMKLVLKCRLLLRHDGAFKSCSLFPKKVLFYDRHDD